MTQSFVSNRRQYARPPTDTGLHRSRPVHPRNTRLTALHSRSVRHCTFDFHQTPPRGSPSWRGPSFRTSALVSSVWGSLRQGPQRTQLIASTSCSAPMPGAPKCVSAALFDPAVPSLRPTSPAPKHEIPPTRPPLLLLPSPFSRFVLLWRRVAVWTLYPFVSTRRRDAFIFAMYSCPPPSTFQRTSCVQWTAVPGLKESAGTGTSLTH